MLRLSAKKCQIIIQPNPMALWREESRNNGSGAKKTNKLIGYVFTNKDGDGKAVRLPRIASEHKTAPSGRFRQKKNQPNEG
jgi:hypothetical protein